jgi:hypothetical protein
MRFLARTLIAIAGCALVAAPAGAVSPSYTGNWPVTITRSHHSNVSGCLTLTDGGSFGWRHSGYGSLVLGGTKYTFGTFQVINGTLVATIEAHGYGQNAGLVFIGSANHGSIGKGVYESVYGGEDFDSGALTFGMKNGC